MRDRAEIPPRIEGHVADEMWTNRQGADGGECHGVTVRRSARRDLHADDECTARTIVDHELLIHMQRELGLDDTPNRIDRAPGCLRQNHSYGPCRIAVSRQAS